MTNSSLRISIGADPELWLRDKTSGKIVSAHNLMPGTKLEPYKVKYGAVQVDGVAAEFNIDPSYDSRTFVGYVQNVKSSILGFVGNNYELVEEPVALFEPGYFRGLPEVVRELGCNPDFNAWTGQINKKPEGDHPVNGNYMRTAAGHIHIGWGQGFDPNDPTHFEDYRIIVKQLDYYLGIYSLMWDSDDRRRSMYGMAGSFRPKTYGVEYRPLSNVWLRSSKLQEWIWSATNQAVLDVIQNGKMLEEKFGDVARQIIDGNVKDWISNSKYTSIHHYTELSAPPRIKTAADIEAERKAQEEHTAKMKLIVEAGASKFKETYSSEDYAAAMKHYNKILKPRAKYPAVSAEEAAQVMQDMNPTSSPIS